MRSHVRERNETFLKTSEGADNCEIEKEVIIYLFCLYKLKKNERFYNILTPYLSAATHFSWGNQTRLRSRRPTTAGTTRRRRSPAKPFSGEFNFLFLFILLLLFLKFTDLIGNKISFTLYYPSTFNNNSPYNFIVTLFNLKYN